MNGAALKPRALVVLEASAHTGDGPRLPNTAACFCCSSFTMSSCAFGSIGRDGIFFSFMFILLGLKSEHVCSDTVCISFCFLGAHHWEVNQL